MLMHGWGRYPRVDCEVTQPLCESEVRRTLAKSRRIIPRGMGRSYGDSSLGESIVSTKGLDHLKQFDPGSGVLRCAAGVMLGDIVDAFAPRGWIPAVSPGTGFVSVGGAIAADVHGKNHHLDGTFSEQVLCLEMLLGDGTLVTASRSENPDLFKATCGGMGLTGVIMAATLQLRKITSQAILRTTTKLSDLDAALEAFERNDTAPYSVAWIDCTASGRALGRSVLFTGRHAVEDGPTRDGGRRLSVPVQCPCWVTSWPVLKVFNAAYHGRFNDRPALSRVPLRNYFYPLDAIRNWNLLYGDAGLLQYQCVFPETSAKAGLGAVLRAVTSSGNGSFLAVLKRCGAANGNPLSFPMAGYTLALDFKATAASFALLDRLDAIVLAHGGRLYLAKDARMTERTFKAGYPRWMEFEQVRARWGAHGKFASRQSLRLGLQ